MATLTKYNILFVYDAYSITFTQEAPNEDEAVNEALEYLKYDFGYAVDNFNYVEAMEVDE